MKKDDAAMLPPNLPGIVIGLGWTCSGDVDFDASVVCLDQNKNNMGVISFAQKVGNGVTHRGDNTTGAGSGDDERIKIDFPKVPMNIMELCVTVNIYTGGVTFQKVKNAYIRVCAQADQGTFNVGHVLAKYPLDG